MGTSEVPCGRNFGYRNVLLEVQKTAIFSLFSCLSLERLSLMLLPPQTRRNEAVFIDFFSLSRDKPLFWECCRATILWVEHLCRPYVSGCLSGALVCHLFSIVARHVRLVARHSSLEIELSRDKTTFFAHFGSFDSRFMFWSFCWVPSWLASGSGPSMDWSSCESRELGCLQTLSTQILRKAKIWGDLKILWFMALARTLNNIHEMRSRNDDILILAKWCVAGILISWF